MIVTSVLALLVIVAAIVTVRQIYYANLRPAGLSQQGKLITIAPGSSAKQIGRQLKVAGLIRADWAFEWYIRSHGLREQLKAGTYLLRPNMSLSDIAGLLTTGRIATDLVTILPAQRLDQIRESLINRYGFVPSEVDAALDPTRYDGHPALTDKPPDASLEGYLYPESFQRTAETKAANIIKLSLDEMQKRLTPDIRAAFVGQGLNTHQAVIIASIVEQEVSRPNDKPVVAQVLLARLRRGMPLGADPTAFYGALRDGKTPSVNYDSPYNTRLHPGLPPGPIGNVSLASMQAVARPAPTDYLYFVAGDDGNTYFSRTREEHEALIRQYCHRLCASP